MQCLKHQYLLVHNSRILRRLWDMQRQRLLLLLCRDASCPCRGLPPPAPATAGALTATTIAVATATVTVATASIALTIATVATASIALTTATVAIAIATIAVATTTSAIAATTATDARHVPSGPLWVHVRWWVRGMQLVDVRHPWKHARRCEQDGLKLLGSEDVFSGHAAHRA